MDNEIIMKHPIDSFMDFLKNKYPDCCMTCWGAGKLKFTGNYITCPVECPDCKGTGNKNLIPLAS